jgi:predicted dehydrogenase
MALRSHRRDFLRSSAALGALAGTGYFTSSALAEPKGANEKVNIAFVGTAGRAGDNLNELLAGSKDQVNIVAYADVDARNAANMAKRMPEAKGYKDWRKMFDESHKSMDAVLVGCTDHVHAPAAAMGMSLGKHCYCEKPLTHTVKEARHLATLAKEKKLATQMGTQIHATDNYRRVVELVKTGVVGPVEEVHVWVGGGGWSNGKFNTGKPVPEYLDWDLWQGPAAEHPYTDNVHPANWRSFWEYGGGMLSDLGCHRMDLAHWALDLRHPTTCWAEGPSPDPVGPPSTMKAFWEYPKRGEVPAVKLTWYHGGLRPEILGTYKELDGSPVKFGDGVLFVGKEGAIYGDYGSLRILPVEKFARVRIGIPEDKRIPNSIGHHKEWVKAIQTGSETTCNFDYSGALTEAVLLGIVAYRVGKKLEWDAKSLKATNCPEADKFITKEYRKGWAIPGLA